MAVLKSYKIPNIVPSSSTIVNIVVPNKKTVINATLDKYTVIVVEDTGNTYKVNGDELAKNLGNGVASATVEYLIGKGLIESIVKSKTTKKPAKSAKSSTSDSTDEDGTKKAPKAKAPKKTATRKKRTVKTKEKE